MLCVFRIFPINVAQIKYLRLSWVNPHWKNVNWLTWCFYSPYLCFSAEKHGGFPRKDDHSAMSSSRQHQHRSCDLDQTWPEGKIRPPFSGWKVCTRQPASIFQEPGGAQRQSEEERWPVFDFEGREEQRRWNIRVSLQREKRENGAYIGVHQHRKPHSTTLWWVWSLQIYLFVAHYHTQCDDMLAVDVMFPHNDPVLTSTDGVWTRVSE